MNFKKFISGVSALTIAASAFAGMAVTANAKSNFEVDSISAEGETQTWLTRDEDTSTDYELVYEADVLVQQGGKAEITYFGGNNTKGWPRAQGPTFILDDSDGDGTVYVKFSTSQGDPKNINTNTPYSYYKSDYTVHVKIVSSQVKGSASDCLGNSTVTLSSDDANKAAFTQKNNSGYDVQRAPYTHGVTIGCRNLDGGDANEYVRAIKTYITGSVTFTNVRMYTNKIVATPVQATAVESFSNNSHASVFTADLTNDSIYSTSNVKAVAVSGEDTAEDSAALTVAPNSPAVISIVVDGKTASELDSLTVSLY